MCPYAPHLQRNRYTTNITCNMSSNYFNDVYDYHRFLLPPLIEPTGGLQPAAGSPQPGSRGADTASRTVNPTDTRTATGGGSAARSPPMCPEVSETLSNRYTVQVESVLSSTEHQHQRIHSDRLVTVCHDGSYESRAGGETVLPVLTSGTVVTHKHTPLQGRHQPTPL